MKKLVIINGTMGVGKSTVCRLLQHKLKRSLFLDGDWCWYQGSDYLVNEATKAMVLDNITHLLNNFLAAPDFEYVIFYWVMHEQQILESVLKPLSRHEFELYKFTLTCSPLALERRLQPDMACGLRDSRCLRRSLERLPLYDSMDTVKIDTSDLTAREVVDKLYSLITA